MNGLLIIIAISSGRLFASFDLFENLSAASFIYQHDTSSMSISLSSFSKNDWLVNRRIRQLEFLTSFRHRIGIAGMEFRLVGSERRENMALAREMKFDAISSVSIRQNLEFNNDVQFDLQKLGGAVYTADNSGVSIDSRLGWSSEEQSASLYTRMDNKRLITRALHGVQFSSKWQHIGLNINGKAEYETNSYELAGVRDREFRKGGELSSQFSNPSVTVEVNAGAWDYAYLKSRTRNHFVKSLDVTAKSQLDWGASAMNIEFSSGLNDNTLSTISLWEKIRSHTLQLNYTHGEFVGRFRASIKRFYYPSVKPDDRDERLIETSVALLKHPIWNSFLDIELGVRQNDFVFVRAERSANTRRRQIYFIKTGYAYNGPIEVKASNEVTAFYTFYRFDPAHDMLLRYIDMDIDISRKFNFTVLNISVRHKLSDYGRFFEDVYYRRSASREYWIDWGVLITRVYGFNLNLRMENYMKAERISKYMESKISVTFQKRDEKFGLSWVNRNGRKFLTMSLSFERGF